MERFFENVTVEASGDGYCVLLDAQPIKTPAKASLDIPTKALAEAIAEEWESQTQKIDPASMPLMQAAATAIDRISTQRQKVIDDIVAYGGTDLVCYRVTYPKSLVVKQSAAWDPVLRWIETRHNVELKITNDISHVGQNSDALQRIAKIVSEQEDMTLAPLYNITALCGSLVIALAVLDGHMSAEEAFEASEIDETHTMEEWGEDAEALERRKNNKNSLIASVRFLELCGVIA